MKFLEGKRGNLVIVSLIALCAVFVIYATMIHPFMTANCFYHEAAVETQLKAEHPEIAKVISFERNIIDFTEIRVMNQNGQLKTYCLNTSDKFDYYLVESED